MANLQLTADIDSQIAKLEAKLNNLLDKIQETQSITVESTSQSSEKKPTPQNTSGKSRKEILAEYEKEYLARLQQQHQAEVEIQRAKEEIDSQKKSRGVLPKGF